jgi:hypothetical protein
VSGGCGRKVLAAIHEARLFRMYIPQARDGLEIGIAPST